MFRNTIHLRNGMDVNIGIGASGKLEIFGKGAGYKGDADMIETTETGEIRNNMIVVGVDSGVLRI